MDGDQGHRPSAPEDTVASAFRDKLAMQAEAQERYASIRDKPAEALCGTVVSLQMNAGLMADLPSLPSLGGRRGGAVPDRASVPDPQQGCRAGASWPRFMPG